MIFFPLSSSPVVFVFLQELSNVDDHYGKLKTSVGLQEDPSINLIRKELVPELRSTVVDFYKWQQKKVRLSTVQFVQIKVVFCVPKYLQVML